MPDELDRLAIPDNSNKEELKSISEQFEEHAAFLVNMAKLREEYGESEDDKRSRRISEERFVERWEEMADTVHRLAVEKGWWEKDRNDGEIIALIHSELSETLEALRHDNPPSEKIPGFSSVEEELADAVIRIMDYVAVRDLQVGAAIVAKHAYNETRPHKHGKKF